MSPHGRLGPFCRKPTVTVTRRVRSAGEAERGLPGLPSRSAWSLLRDQRKMSRRVTARVPPPWAPLCLRPAAQPPLGPRCSRGRGRDSTPTESHFLRSRPAPRRLGRSCPAGKGWQWSSRIQERGLVRPGRASTGSRRGLDSGRGRGGGI